MLKLTKSSEQELRNYHVGSGVIFLNTSKGILKINIHLGKNGKFYTGTMELDEYLKALSKELNND
ncbi:MAG TPA: hypothetical protein ENG63_03505 [Candidatus Desulfofervidus auxilii]|uniref:Uncharacterized protein n=1 Tax=Desulfofervidus auxilii TaxID=1621989 RepID=A0A7C0Y9J8_DESA2|nr:hypothetical protein [Candidatus Desulfofervidus auxilii]